jgi:enoyl-CoA hydratase
MGSLVTYRLDGPVAAITMDDGKVNALSPAMLDELAEAFGKAAADGATVLLSGREGVFSAGFDVAVLRAGGAEMRAMVRAGFDLAVRLLGYPRPVVVACTGHTIAMGVFLLLSGDYRLGGDGEYRIAANEVSIGLPLPEAAVAIMRQRLSPPAFHRAAVLAEVYGPGTAVAAGMLDEIVPAADLAGAARAAAHHLSQLDPAAHAETKLRVRAPVLTALQADLARDGGLSLPPPRS